jgi:mono/diheme cytochrome c family protein
MRRLIWLVVALVLAGGAAFWLLTTPQTLTAANLPAHTPDIGNGERIFNVGGCASCHAAPSAGDCTAKSTDHTLLAGGRCLKTPFGTFYAPNISSDKVHGLGGWTDAEFATAMLKGVGRAGEHLYPSFPYSSYQHMTLPDVMDLRAYLATLPAAATDAPPHDLPLPFQVRRGVGLWKLLYLDDADALRSPSPSAEVQRGAYLVNGPGHCGQCHTTRDAFGGPMTRLHLAGGKAPDGPGWIPNLTPHKNGLAEWSADDISGMLTTGMLPDGDSVGGSMVEVQLNLSKLPAVDRKAIALYLKSLPPVDNPKPPKK